MCDADEKHECLTNPAGRGYTGSVNVTASGKPCVPWTEVVAQFSYALSDESTADALNYCRYIPDQHWHGTSCAVRRIIGVQLERCIVPYCGGRNRFCLLLLPKLQHFCLINYEVNLFSGGLFILYFRH